MTIDEVCAATGLDANSASLACERRFSEPLQWTGKCEHLPLFKQAAHDLGLDIIGGGRFLHALQQGVSKQAALEHWLQSTVFAQPFIVALGDSDNDIPMLRQADLAVVVNNPSKPFPQFINQRGKTQTLFTSAYGPEGWNAAILAALEKHYG